MAANPPLAFLSTNDRSLVYELEDPETSIGRAEDNDIVLQSSRSISSRHCRIEVREDRRGGGGWRARLHDLGSLNGTFLNDARVQGTHAELKSGDSLRLGYDTTIYRFHLAREAPADLLGPGAGGGAGATMAGGATSPSRAAGRATDWGGASMGRSPHGEGGARSPSGRYDRREPHGSPQDNHNRFAAAGVSSAEAARRRGSLARACTPRTRAWALATVRKDGLSHRAPTCWCHALDTPRARWRVARARARAPRCRHHRCRMPAAQARWCRRQYPNQARANTPTACCTCRYANLHQ